MSRMAYLRYMALGDVLATHAIGCRASGACGWPREMFHDCLALGCHGVVLCLNNKIVGFLVFDINHNIVNILNVGIEPNHQNRGLGQWLLSTMLVEFVRLGARACRLEVRVSNTAAIALYEKLGFEQQGCHPNYYDDDDGPVEDALIYRKSLKHSPSFFSHPTHQHAMQPTW